MKLFKKIATFIVTICTLFAFVGMSVSTSAAGTAFKYEKVTTAPTDWSGEYLIVYEDGNVCFDGSLSTLDAVSNTVSVTITDGVIESSDTINNATFTVASIDGGYTIKSASGFYIGQTSDDNGLESSSSSTYSNTISMNDNATINIVSGKAYLRYNAASNQNRFRYYKSSTYTKQKAICLYKKVEVIEDSNVTAVSKFKSLKTSTSLKFTYDINTSVDYIITSYSLVTDVTSLSVGDTIIVVGNKDSSYYALSTTQNNNNRGQVSIVVENNSTTGADGVQNLILEAGSVENTFAFNTGSGYLYAASSSSNYLRTKDSVDANASFTIAITDDVTSIVAQGTYTHNVLKYNSTSPVFSCYASGQNEVSIYKANFENAEVNKYEANEVDLRFGTLIEADLYEDLMATEAEVKFGVAAIKSTTLSTDGKTLADYATNEKVLFECTPVRVNADGVADEEGEYYQFALVIKGLQESCTVEFTAACYVSIDGVVTLMGVAENNTIVKAANAYVNADDTSKYNEHLGVLEYLSKLTA